MRNKEKMRKEREKEDRLRDEARAKENQTIIQIFRNGRLAETKIY